VADWEEITYLNCKSRKRLDWIRLDWVGWLLPRFWLVIIAAQMMLFSFKLWFMNF